MREAPVREQPPERTLILGWNRRAPIIINELDQYVAPGSEVMVVADTPEEEVEIAGQNLQLRHLTVSFRRATPPTAALMNPLTLIST
jgi:hypothetical protein